MNDLTMAIHLSNSRLKTNAASRDLLAEARKDPSLNPLHSLPAFQKLVSTN
jgi:hypothetical protein